MKASKKASAHPLFLFYFFSGKEEQEEEERGDGGGRGRGKNVQATLEYGFGNGEAGRIWERTGKEEKGNGFKEGEQEHLGKQGNEIMKFTRSRCPESCCRASQFLCGKTARTHEPTHKKCSRHCFFWGAVLWCTCKLHRVGGHIRNFYKIIIIKVIFETNFKLIRRRS